MCEFVSGDPKNCEYKSINSVTGEEKSVCKVRGITLNYSASHLVNFESIRRMNLRGVGGETDSVSVHTERNIKRKRGNGRVQIVTEPEDKTYRVLFLRGNDYTKIVRPLRVYKGSVSRCGYQSSL